MGRAVCDSKEAVSSQSVQLAFRTRWQVAKCETQCSGQVSMRGLNTKVASHLHLDLNEFEQS
jgi:hypothetical protein